MSRFNPFSYRAPRPRRLTWYSLITQFFSLLGRLIGRAATGGSPRTSSRTRRTTYRRSTYRR